MRALSANLTANPTPKALRMLSKNEKNQLVAEPTAYFCLQTRAEGVAVAQVVEEMHSEVAGQVLEDAGEGQWRPQVRPRAPEGLRSNGRAINHGSSSSELEASQSQRAAAVEERIDGQLGGVLGLLDDAHASAELGHQSAEQWHVHLTVGRAAGVGDVAAQAAVLVDRFQQDSLGGEHIAVPVVENDGIADQGGQLGAALVANGEGHRFVQKSYVPDGVLILQRVRQLKGYWLVGYPWSPMASIPLTSTPSMVWAEKSTI